MRYWKVKSTAYPAEFTVGKIYESDNSGHGITDDEQYTYRGVVGIYAQTKFEEVTRRDYLFQLQKEGKLEFNEQDFINGDLAVRFEGRCGFSSKLSEICELNKIRNFNYFDSCLKYAVIENKVETDMNYNSQINKLPCVNSKNIKVEFTHIPKCNHKDFSININSKDGVTTCKYWLNGKLENESTVKLYYKDEFNVQTAVEEVLKKTFMKKPFELFEYQLENKLGRTPTPMELVEAYRKEIK